MINRFILRLTDIIIIILLVISLALQFSSKENNSDIHIIIFDGVATLPNDFYLQSKIDQGVYLLGDHGSRVEIGGIVSPELLSYSRDHMLSESSRCGIKIVIGDSPVKWALLYDAKSFMYLVGDNINQTTNKAVKSICNTKDLRKISNNPTLDPKV